MRQLPAATQELIAELYRTGLGARGIALRVGVSKTAVLCALRRSGVEIRPASCPRPVKAPDHIRREIVRLYATGLSTQAVSGRVGLRQSTVYKILRRCGVVTRTYEQAGRNPHHIHDFFADIDSDAKAWVLGLLSADGCVPFGTNTIRLSLQARDADAVEKVRDRVCPTAQVRRVTAVIKGTLAIKTAARTNAILSWNSKRMVDDLRRLGVGPRKSMTVRPWDGPSHLMPAYFRGLIDGDGWWSRPRSSPPKGFGYAVGLCGTQAVVEAFRRFVADRTGSRPTPRRHGNIWVFKTGGAGAVRTLADVLYDGATVWLDRKRAVAEEARQAGRR